VLVLAVLAGCQSMTQVQSSARHSCMGLSARSLPDQGLALITPASPTSREEDRQVVAFLFANTLARSRPEIRVVTLAETLGAINRSGLADRYRDMYEVFDATGMLPRETLTAIANAAGARYIGLLSMAEFGQSSRGRFSLFGVRLVDTRSANIRLFFQVWDSVDGSVAWEGNEEVSIAYDSALERPVTFEQVAEQASESIVARLPGGPDAVACERLGGITGPGVGE